jgi:energy-coupling factor transporter transmembrane protein EcfT
VVLATHDDVAIGASAQVHRLQKRPSHTFAPHERRPLVARCGPLSLLLGSMLAIPAGILSPRWQASLAVLGVQAVLAVLGLAAPREGHRESHRAATGLNPPREGHRAPNRGANGLAAGRGLARPTGRLRRVVVRLAPGVVGALSVAWSTWLLGSHDVQVAVTAGLRVLIIVFPSTVLIPYVDADALGDHLAQRLRLPARPVVAFSAALQRVNSFGDIWTEIGRARRVRGLGPGRSPRDTVSHAWALTVGLLVRSLGSAAALALAMDARGFATAYRRTWFAGAPWRVADSLLVVAAVLPLMVAVLF